MGLSLLANKKLLIKGFSTLSGISGASVGGWQFYESTGEKSGSVSNVNEKWIDTKDLYESIGTDLGKSPKELAKKGSSCYSRYLKKSPFNIGIDKLSEPTNKETAETWSSKTLNFPEEYDFGCVIVSIHNGNWNWIEALLWKKGGTKATLLYFFQSSQFYILRFDVESSGEIKSSQKIEWWDIFDLKFLYGNVESDKADLILDSGKNIKIEVSINTSSSAVVAEINFEGTNIWIERDKYCESMKGKAESDEDEKVKNLCMNN